MIGPHEGELGTQGENRRRIRDPYKRQRAGVMLHSAASARWLCTETRSQRWKPVSPTKALLVVSPGNSTEPNATPYSQAPAHVMPCLPCLEDWSIMVLARAGSGPSESVFVCTIVGSVLTLFFLRAAQGPWRGQRPTDNLLG